MKRKNVKGKSRRRRERIIHSGFFLIALASIITLLLIVGFLFKEGIPVFEKISLSDFVFGIDWYPDDDPAEFGILTFIVASLAVTFLSSAISIPIGVLTAIFIAEIASRKLREIVKPIIELLAAFPSVVIGFFGMVVVAPFLLNLFDLKTGLNLFNASLMLAFMSVPTICSISEDAIFGVPNELKEASFGLGATHWETIWRVIIPASISGITTAVILGMSRAIGETMVVLMVAGGAEIIPDSIFDPVRPLPAIIASEMAETPSGGDHYHALFAAGIALFIFTMIFNLIAEHISNKYRQVGAATL